jgi:hypothetical protein
VTSGRRSVALLSVLLAGAEILLTHPIVIGELVLGGWADAHLLASVHLAGAALWTADDALVGVASALRVALTG